MRIFAWRCGPMTIAALTARLAAACQAAPGAVPAYSGDEPASLLYIDPRPVEIAGYPGSAMEPFVSPDGKYLFFNSAETAAENKLLHFAVRTGRLAFKYLGEVPGVNMHDREIVDGVPALDAAGRFYFTSTRSYMRDFRSIFVGTFDGKAVRDVRPVEGSFNPDGPAGLINMDVSVSLDGSTLFVSRTQFAGGPIPVASDLLVASRVGEGFDLDPRSDTLMRNINTAALEYAPAISTDRLELFFTRASSPAGLRLMVARRPAPDAPFEQPCVLSEFSGFIEAPSPSLDGKHLYFHKKDGTLFRIYRAERNPGVAPCGEGR